jgi:hypothetical protein
MSRRLLPSEKRQRGTSRPYRDAGVIELVEPDSLPQRPDSLTEAGEAIWLDNVGRVAATRLVTERDSTMFGAWCNLIGAIDQCWRSGAVPPSAHLTEARRLAEAFGLLGSRSRLTARAAQIANPFVTNGVRARPSAASAR